MSLKAIREKTMLTLTKLQNYQIYAQSKVNIRILLLSNLLVKTFIKLFLFIDKLLNLNKSRFEKMSILDYSLCSRSSQLYDSNFSHKDNELSGTENSHIHLNDSFSKKKTRNRKLINSK